MLTIIDVDNCIAHDEWRRYMIKHPTFAGDRFHDYHLASAFDRIGNRHLLASETRPIVIITAMPERYRVLRELWLNMHSVKYDRMMMRDDWDRRHAVDVKRDLFNEAIALFRAAPHEVVAYDDRDDILAMYRQKGATAFKAILGKEHQ
jgi:hypothetical protein